MGAEGEGGLSVVVRPVPAPLLLDTRVEGDRVLWRHEYAHAGDRPDLDEITRCLAD